MRKALLGLLILLMAGSVGHAAVTATMGAPQTWDSTTFYYPVEVDHDGYIDTYGANRVKYEEATTSDTLTQRESGKTIMFIGTAVSTFTLPPAANGLTYTFVNGKGSLGIYIDPGESNDVLFHSTCIQGDRLGNSTQASGDSITVIGDDDDRWYVIPHSGTWADYN